MPWRQRVIEYLQQEQADLERRVGLFECGRCQMWEADGGEPKDVTGEYVAGLRVRIAEIEKILIEEELS